MPVRASPSGTRRASAAHCCGSSGASVITTPITDPAPGTAGSHSPSGSSSASVAPRGTPAIRSSCREPKLHCRNTPTVYGPPGASITRLAEPLPPL